MGKEQCLPYSTIQSGLSKSSPNDHHLQEQVRRDLWGRLTAFRLLHQGLGRLHLRRSIFGMLQADVLMDASVRGLGVPE